MSASENLFASQNHCNTESSKLFPFFFPSGRTLLTDIGNIISFVRLIRAARKKLSSNEMPYLPALNLSPNPSQLNSQAGNEINKLISETLQHNDSDFVRAFVDVFKGVSPDSKNSSMSCFFCLVPCLCLCWMEASLHGKEMMHKKNITQDGYYTDDGFAVGLTFCLVVFDQIEQYERYVLRNSWLFPLFSCPILRRSLSLLESVFIGSNQYKINTQRMKKT